MQVMVYYFRPCGNNTNTINNHNTKHIMVAELTLKCAWFSLEGFIFKSVNFELSQ